MASIKSVLKDFFKFLGYAAIIVVFLEYGLDLKVFRASECKDLKTENQLLKQQNEELKSKLIEPIEIREYEAWPILDSRASIRYLGSNHRTNKFVVNYDNGTSDTLFLNPGDVKKIDYEGQTNNVVFHGGSHTKIRTIVISVRPW